MPNRKTFSFDEEADAEEIILNGFAGKNIDYTKMYIIAKYFRKKFKYGAVRLERELISFCIEHDKNFNPITEAELIKKWIKVAMTYGLRKIQNLEISKKEIEFLKNIKNSKDRRLLYVILIMAKALKNNRSDNERYYIWYSNLSDVVYLSELSNIKETDIADLICKYKKYFTSYSAEKELIGVNFAEHRIEDPLIIENPKDMIGYYKLLFGIKNTGMCMTCGEEFVKTANSQKFCKNCKADRNINTNMPSICEICGDSFVKASNRQKVCSHCTKILANNRAKKFRKERKSD